MSLSRSLALFLLIDLLCMTLVVYAGTAGNRDSDLKHAIDDAQQKLNGLIDSIWGGKCINDDQCAAFVGYCDKTKGFSGSLGLDGQCRPSILVWIILSASVLLFFGCCIFLKICCGICSCILDCLGRCFRDKGYYPRSSSPSLLLLESPANTG